MNQLHYLIFVSPIPGNSSSKKIILDSPFPDSLSNLGKGVLERNASTSSQLTFEVFRGGMRFLYHACHVWTRSLLISLTA